MRHLLGRKIYHGYRIASAHALARPTSGLSIVFAGLRAGADRLLSARRLTPLQHELNRLWKAIYFARYGTTSPYRLLADRPVATDSADHRWPRGSLYNNSTNRRFNLKLYDYFQRKSDLRVLDIGCAGGGFVRSILEDGYEAIGIEGSDVSKRLRSGEWDTIPHHLFTADATAPFSFVNREGAALRFDCITAWEVLEHIPEDRIAGFLANVYENLSPGGIAVASVAMFPDGDPVTGVIYHLTVRDQPWWLARFRDAGLVPSDTHLFETRDYVRGHGVGLQDWDPADGYGFHIVVVKAGPRDGPG
ncbi:MAG: class I SAM-dependent methyltransferase [Chloroflexi bacterium]|nr:class I SAM-dependent methyltransferase [Chloroflexota bacterium]